MMSPLKRGSEGFLQPMVDEFCAQVKEMLEVGAIVPSQSPWCNAVILVWQER